MGGGHDGGSKGRAGVEGADARENIEGTRLGGGG
jgi:hypothetical protein